jgi:SecD/SecF fusion protein
LFFLGQGPIKGFAITLIIGITCSFFTAVYISRLVIEWMVRDRDDVKISFETPIATLMRKKRDFNFIGNRKKAYMFSVSFILVGLILIAIQGLNLGVDFKGGRSYLVSFGTPVDATAMRNALVAGFENAGTEVKNYGSSSVMKVTTSYLVDDESAGADDNVKEALVEGVKKYTGMNYIDNDGQVSDKTFTISSSSKVGATVADDIRDSAFEAGILAIVIIFIYIFIRFKKVQYSAGAIIALIHDSLFVISAFAIARVLGISFEIDQVFIAALLTIIGYSINDTVIVFDRIREFLNSGTSHVTLSRTLITSGTTLITVVVLLFFGGEVLRGFSFALFVGFVIGTYSSIFIAAPVVIDLDKEKELGPQPLPAK